MALAFLLSIVVLAVLSLVVAIAIGLAFVRYRRESAARHEAALAAYEHGWHWGDFHGLRMRYPNPPPLKSQDLARQMRSEVSRSLEGLAGPVSIPDGPSGPETGRT